MNLKLVAYFCILFLCACITPPPKQYEGELITSAPEFPLGKYVHAVDVDVPGRGNWQMQGVAKITASGINLVGLSPMGTTVFKIVDSYSKELAEVTVYQPELKTYEDKLFKFYMQLRPHLAGRKLDHSADIPSDWRVEYFTNKKSAGLPPTLAVRSPHFSISVEVEQYEP
jgi:hypothetical protein